MLGGDLVGLGGMDVELFFAGKLGAADHAIHRRAVRGLNVPRELALGCKFQSVEMTPERAHDVTPPPETTRCYQALIGAIKVKPRPKGREGPMKAEA